MKAHIHTPDDGRGRRRVRLDGKVIERAFYADTKVGEVRYYEFPLRVVAGEAATLTGRGRVEVERY